MLWAEVPSTELKTLLIFPDEGVKINQHVCLSTLKDKVVSWESEIFGDEGITLPQDGATLTQPERFKKG